MWLPPLELEEVKEVHGLSASKPQGNIASLNTAALWDAGFLGQGVTVATIDSGVRWTHEALRGNYRGFSSGQTLPVDHDYAMWDAASKHYTPDTVDVSSARFEPACGVSTELK